MGFGSGTKTTHSFAREMGVRKVYPNDMVAHTWAQQKQSEGRSGNGNFWFSGEWLYSYRTAIARIVVAPSGEKIMLTRDEKFSVTTSQHMPSGKVFDGRHFHVPFIGSCEGQTQERYADTRDFHAANIGVFFKRWSGRLAEVRKRTAAAWLSGREGEVSGARYWPENYGGKPEDILQAIAAWQARLVAGLLAYRTQAEEYAAAFGVSLPADLMAYHTVELAAQQAAGIVAAFRATLDNPKNKAARERSAAKRAEKIGGLVESMLRHRTDWLAADDSTLMAAYKPEYYHRNGPRAPTIPYRASGYTRGQINAAESAIRTSERDSGQADAIQAKEGRLDALANAARRANDAADFAKWQAGESVRCPESFRSTEAGGAYLRVVGNELQTSQGARVPLSDAVKVFRVAKAMRAKHWRDDIADNVTVWTRNGSTLPVGNFQVDSFRADGSFKAGCHVVQWAEIEAAAVAAGVAFMAGDFDSIQGRA